MGYCSGHCVVTEYRQTAIALTTWSGETDDGRKVGAPINSKWKFYSDWLKAFTAGLAAHWSKDDDCPCDADCDCSCDTGDARPGPWHKASKPRKFRQPVAFPGYKSFFIHGTFELEWRTTEGICLCDPGEEDRGDVVLQWVGDTEALAAEAGLAAGPRSSTRAARKRG